MKAIVEFVKSGVDRNGEAILSPTIEDVEISGEKYRLSELMEEFSKTNLGQLSPAAMVATLCMKIKHLETVIELLEEDYRERSSGW